MNNGSEIRRVLEQTFNLSDLTNIRAYLRRKRIGKLEDLAIVDMDKYAEVTHVCIGRPFGQSTIYTPWNTVRSLSGKEVVVDLDNVESFAGDPPPGVVL